MRKGLATPRQRLCGSGEFRERGLELVGECACLRDARRAALSASRGEGLTFATAEIGSA